MGAGPKRDLLESFGCAAQTRNDRSLATGEPVGEQTLRPSRRWPEQQVGRAWTLKQAQRSQAASPTPSAEPIDLAHLSRHTFGEPDLEREVLEPFMSQSDAALTGLAGLVSDFQLAYRA